MVDKFERGRDGKELDLERSRKICHFQNLLTLPLILRKLARKSFYCRGLHVYAILCTLVRPTRIPQVPSSGNEELLFATLHTILCVPLSLIIPYLVGRSYTWKQYAFTLSASPRSRVLKSLTPQDQHAQVRPYRVETGSIAASYIRIWPYIFGVMDWGPHMKTRTSGWKCWKYWKCWWITWRGSLEWKKKGKKKSSWHRFGSSIPFFFLLFFVLRFLTIGIVCGSSSSIWVWSHILAFEEMPFSALPFSWSCAQPLLAMGTTWEWPVVS